MDSHDDFVELRRLLTLKRHEQPPPGYFEDFSPRVIARIRAGEHLPEHFFFDLFSSPASWLRRLWASLETRPVYAGGFGLAVCGVLMAGVLLSESAEPSAAASAAPSSPVMLGQQAGPEFMASPFTSVATSLQPESRDSLFHRAQAPKRGEAVLISAPGGNPR